MLRRFSRIRALLGKPLGHRAERFFERSGHAVIAGGLERITARDPAGARTAMAAHLEGVAAWWRNHVTVAGEGGDA